MAIKRRNGGDDNGGGSNPASLRRFKKDPRKSTLTKKPKNIMTGELGEVVNLYNANTPGVIRQLSTPVSYGRSKTGILSVDIALAGGFKRSRAGMIYGERSSGKTTLASRIMANCQRTYPDSASIFIDIEGSADKTWMEIHGCDPDRVIIVEPGTGEEAVDQTDALIRTREVSSIVVDSIAMLTPFKEIDSSAEDQQIGLQARLVGKMLRRLNNAILQERRREHYPTVILLNQFRMKAGLVFGDPRTLPGGKALEFVTSQQLETKNKEVTVNGVVHYNEHTVLVTKDKTGGRYKEAKFKLIRDEATDLPVGFIDQAKTILDLGALTGHVKGKYEVDGIKHKFRSADAFRDYLVENPAQEELICDKIVGHFRKKWRIDE